MKVGFKLGKSIAKKYHSYSNNLRSVQKIGLNPRQLKKATGEIAAAAGTSSRWLWLSRNHTWNPCAGEG